jgi:hypothetical protein
MNRLLVVILITVLPSLVAFGQESLKEDKPKLILSPGVSYQSQLFTELNLMYSRFDYSHSGSVIWGPRVGLEANFKKDRFILAPKVGYELSGLLLSLRGNAIGYMDEKKLDLRILPEIGTSLFGTVNLTYGYSFPLLEYKSSVVSKHRVTLTTNFHLDLWRAVF